MTGDEIHDTMRSEETYFTLEETKAAVDEAHMRGKRVCAHARSNDSVKQCAKAGVDVIYHASFADDEAIEMLEKIKDTVFISPAINFPYTSATGEAIPYGLTIEMAVKKGMSFPHRWLLKASGCRAEGVHSMGSPRKTLLT